MVLNSTLRLGSVTLRNRIVSAPMERNYCHPDGTITADYIDYLVARAAGGAALLYTEASFVSAEGKSRPRQFGIAGGQHVPGLTELARRVHEHGALVGVQLMHGGRTSSRRVSGLQPIAPSAVPLARPLADLPRAMTTEEAERVIRDFGAAAARASSAGIDVISIHGAHGYLVHSFMSPLTNRRDDRFGDPTVFVTELLDAVVAGARGTPVGMRISAFEGNPGGLTTDQQFEVLSAARPERLDFLEISAGNYESPQWMAQGGEFPRGGLAEYAAPYRVFGVPVGVAGRIADPATAEGILASGRADYVMVGRALHADPEAARHWLEGTDYRPCIACNVCADDLGDGPVRCSVNAWVAGGRPTVPLTARPLDVLVVGAGPAGLESARLAAVAGHHVELVDAHDRIGGQFRLASELVGSPEYHRILDWYERELERLHVTVTLGERLDADGVVARGADAVLVATGAHGTPSALPDPGGRAVDVREWLHGLDATNPPDETTIIGGDREALAVAYHLARAGRSVRIVAEGEDLAPEVGGRGKLLSAPFVAGSPLVARDLRTQVVSIDADSVEVVDATGRGRRLAARGDIVTTFGSTVDRALYDDLLAARSVATVVHVSEHGAASETFLHAMVAAGLAVARLAAATR